MRIPLLETIESKQAELPIKLVVTIYIVGIFFSFLVLTYAVYVLLPVHENANPPITWGWGVDWKGTIRPGSLNLITGQTPYTSVIRCLPPWIYLAVSPIAVLPPEIGTAGMFVLTYLVYSFVLYRLNAKPWVILAFLCNSFTFMNAKNGNVDFLAVLGFILPPQIGLFFVLIKPQIGIGITVFWLFEAWKKGKFKEVLRVFAPVTIAYLCSFLIYGLWPLKIAGMTKDVYNASLWPIGVLIGLVLIVKSLKEQNPLYAMGASPFLAPYVNFTSYALVLFPFIPNEVLMLIAVALSWR